MRPFRLSVATLLAMGAMGTVGGIAAAPASALTGTPVMFTGVTASPTTISYGNNTVTVTGQLDQAVPQTGGPVAGPPVPDTAVSLEYASHGTVLDTVTTDANGDFTTTATLPAGATLWLVTAAGTPYADVQIGQVTIYAKQQTPVVTLNPQPASTVAAGANLTFTGKATVNVNGTVTPLPSAPVDLYLNGTGVSATTTAADGTFTLPAADVTAGGQWTAGINSPTARSANGPSLYGDSTSNADTVNVQHTTRVVNVSVPATAEAHNTETIKGTVQEADGTAWTPASSIWASIYYRNSSTGSWIWDGQVATNSNGAFSANLGLKPGTGTKQVQARVLKQTAGDTYLASNGPVDTTKVYDQTCFTGTNVEHFDGRTIVGGRIIDWCGSKTQTFATVSGSAQIYYRKGTSGSWTHLGSAKLGQGGTFAYTKGSTLHGYFYVTYPAQGYFRASGSAIHHLS